jgi:protein required for attachment to host cells
MKQIGGYIMKPIRTLVLVTDEEKAIFYEKTGANRPLVELQHLDKSNFEDTDQRYSDVPGRSSAAPGMAVHAMDRTTTEREQMRDAFAVHVLEAAERRLSRNDYRRVAIAAPPKMLGILRNKMKGALAAAERIELDKNLTAETPEALVERFSELTLL